MAKLTQFQHGVLHAAAQVQGLHDEPVVAADVLKNAGLSNVECCEMDDYYKESLREANTMSGMKLKGLQ